MSITFNCTCGQKLETDDKDAGKQAKCPRCGLSITIPSPAKEETICPACGNPMEDDAIICVQCGFNKKTGRQLAAAYDVGEDTQDESVPAPSVSGVRQVTRRARRGEEEIPEESPVFSSFTKSFIFPLKGTALWMVILMPLLRPISTFIPLGGIIYFALFYSCLTDIMRTAASGPKFTVERPDFSDFWSEMLLPALIVFFAILIVIGIPLGVTMSLIGGTAVLSQLSELSSFRAEILPGLAGGAIVGVLVALFCASYFPMTLVVAGIYQTFGSSLNPVFLFRSISRIPKEYALVALFLYIIIVLAGLINLGFLLIPFGGFLSPMISFYFYAVIASRLGFMYYYNKERLGW